MQPIKPSDARSLGIARPAIYCQVTRYGLRASNGRDPHTKLLSWRMVPPRWFHSRKPKVQPHAPTDMRLL
jgi:hypothetical protein